MPPSTSEYFVDLGGPPPYHTPPDGFRMPLVQQQVSLPRHFGYCRETNMDSKQRVPSWKVGPYGRHLHSCFESIPVPLLILFTVQ